MKVKRSITFALAFFCGISWTGLANYVGAEMYKLTLLGFFGIGFITLCQIVIDWNNNRIERLKMNNQKMVVGEETKWTNNGKEKEKVKE